MDWVVIGGLVAIVGLLFTYLEYRRRQEEKQEDKGERMGQIESKLDQLIKGNDKQDAQLDKIQEDVEELKDEIDTIKQSLILLENVHRDEIPAIVTGRKRK